MSNSELITREVIADSLYKLTKQQEGTLESCIKTLTTLKDSGNITESSLRSLSNVWRELDSLREVYFSRLLHSAKRGDMLKD
jgi:hypothetical protein